MKQHITIEQAKELSVEFIMEHLNNDKLNLCIAFEESFWEAVSKYLNIGKMIEILEDDLFIGRNAIFITDEKPSPFWLVGLLCEEDASFNGKELCDALWKSVKYVLALKTAQ